MKQIADNKDLYYLEKEQNPSYLVNKTNNISKHVYSMANSYP